MSNELFRPNSWPTLGIELELQLMDAETMALVSGITRVLGDLAPSLGGCVKPEFMQCYVEINSSVGCTVDDLQNDLVPKLRAVERAAARHGLRLAWAGTHPFSRWQDQQITPNARYFRLADTLRETVVRPVTFGLHVHVGVKSGDHAIRISNLLQHHVPLLLALSANSPFWQGRATGHHAHRIEVLESFPTGGPPPRLDGWDAYQSLVCQMVEAGFIDSPKEIWWDVRPNADTGTIELRICDMPPDLPCVLGLTSLTQCLVHDLSARLDRNEIAADVHPLLIRQNRWRACRYGLDAVLVDPAAHDAQPARRVGAELAASLNGTAAELGCARHLEYVQEMAASATGAERQLADFQDTGSLVDVVRRSVQRSRFALNPAPPVVRLTGDWHDHHPIPRPGALLS